MQLFLVDDDNHHNLQAVPKGKAQYRACLRSHSTLRSIDAQDIHERASKEVQEISEKIMKLGTEKLGLANVTTVKDVFKSVLSRSDQYFQSKEEALDYARALIQDKIKPSLSGMFESEYLSPKKLDFFVLESPKFGASAFYSGPSLDGAFKG